MDATQLLEWSEDAIARLIGTTPEGSEPVPGEEFSGFVGEEPNIVMELADLTRFDTVVARNMDKDSDHHFHLSTEGWFWLQPELKVRTAVTVGVGSKILYEVTSRVVFPCLGSIHPFERSALGPAKLTGSISLPLDAFDQLQRAFERSRGVQLGRLRLELRTLRHSEDVPGNLIVTGARWRSSFA